MPVALASVLRDVQADVVVLSYNDEAWVSLDERDRDVASFWTYVLLAADRAAPGTATAALARLQTGRATIEARRRAIELEPRYAGHAADDPDLDSIRDDSRFPSG